MTDNITALLQPGALPRHARIFEAIQKLVDRGQIANIVTLKAIILKSWVGGHYVFKVHADGTCLDDLGDGSFKGCNVSGEAGLNIGSDGDFDGSVMVPSMLSSPVGESVTSATLRLQEESVT